MRNKEEGKKERKKNLAPEGTSLTYDRTYPFWVRQIFVQFWYKNWRFNCGYKKYWRAPLFFKEAFFLSRSTYLIFSVLNFCNYTRILLNDTKFDIFRPNRLVCKCHNKYNGVAILSVTTVCGILGFWNQGFIRTVRIRCSIMLWLQ